MVDDQRSKRGSLLLPLALGALSGLIAVLLVQLSGQQPSPTRDVVGNTAPAPK